MVKRKTLGQAIFTLFLMVLMPASAWAAFRLLPEWTGFAVSGAGTVLAVVSYLAGRGRNIGYLLCTFFNTVGAGCAVGAFYHYQTPFPGVKELLLVAGIWTGFLLLFLLAMNLKASPWLAGIAFFLWLTGMVVSVVFWCMGAGPWWSFSFYLGLCAGFWSAAIYADTMVWFCWSSRWYSAKAIVVTAAAATATAVPISRQSAVQSRRCNTIFR